MKSSKLTILCPTATLVPQSKLVGFTSQAAFENVLAAELMLEISEPPVVVVPVGIVGIGTYGMEIHNAKGTIKITSHKKLRI